jgi:hypothetical protein
MAKQPKPIMASNDDYTTTPYGIRFLYLAHRNGVRAQLSQERHELQKSRSKGRRGIRNR